MHFPRVALGVLFTAGALAFACSDDETIIAVNVDAADNVGRVSVLRVNITKQGETPINFELTPTREDVAAGQGGETRIGDQTDRRVTVTGWDRGVATVTVDAIGADGGVLVSDTTEITVRPNDTVAAFVALTREMPPPMGGMGGMGGTDAGGTGGTDAGGTGGTDAGGTGGTDAGGTGGTDAGGTGGTDAGGGADASGGTG